MKLQLLVAAVNQSATELPAQMNIGSDAIVVNQTDHYDYQEFEYKGHQIRFFSMAEKGVGLNRNNSLLRAEADICLFADEDISYVDGYETMVLEAFEKYPQADMLLFNVQAAPGRETYHIEEFGRVRRFNCGRYPTYSFAIRTSKVHKRNITFSLLFGGGAKYSNGEDSLFIQECIKKGMKVYKVPVLIGKEIERPSTWFTGYNEKFFFDRGVLYWHLYGSLRHVMALRFLFAHKNQMCQEISVKEAYKIMKKGMKEAAN